MPVFGNVGKYGPGSDSSDIGSDIDSDISGSDIDYCFIKKHQQVINKLNINDNQFLIDLLLYKMYPWKY